MRKDIYESPLSSRYASEYMLHLFSPDMRFQTWRRLWVALAHAEHELGLPITQEQVDELAAHITDIDYEVAEKREHEVRHDVMAHVYAYGKAAPSAARHHPPRRDELLCDGQRRFGAVSRRPQIPEKAASQRDGESCGICPRIRRHADARLHALSARTARDDRQARDAVDAGLPLGP